METFDSFKKAKEYIESLKNKVSGTYSIKIIAYERDEYNEKSGAFFDLKKSLLTLNSSSGIYVSLDLSECRTNLSIEGDFLGFGTGKGAFCNCSALESIVLPKLLRVIEGVAFDSCKSIKSVKMFSNILRIEIGAFYGCQSLENIELHEGLVEIGDRVFGCTSIKSIEIPSSVKEIGTSVFTECSKLESITFKEEHEWYATETEDSEKRIKTEKFSIVRPVDLGYYYWHRAD